MYLRSPRGTAASDCVVRLRPASDVDHHQQLVVSWPRLVVIVPDTICHSSHFDGSHVDTETEGLAISRDSTMKVLLIQLVFVVPTTPQSERIVILVDVLEAKTNTLFWMCGWMPMMFVANLSMLLEEALYRIVDWFKKACQTWHDYLRILRVSIPEHLICRQINQFFS